MKKAQRFGCTMLMAVIGLVVFLKASMLIGWALDPESELPREAMYYARSAYMHQALFGLWIIVWTSKFKSELNGD